MKHVFGTLVVMCLARPMAAQLAPEVRAGDQVRVIVDKRCFDVFHRFRCGDWARGEVVAVAADTVHVRLGRQPDSVVVWTPGRRGRNLEVLTGHRLRTDQTALDIVSGAGAGAVGGVALIYIVCSGLSCDPQPGHVVAFAAGFAISGAVYGLFYGLARSNEVWRRVKPGAPAVQPVLSHGGGRTSIGLGLSF